MVSDPLRAATDRPREERPSRGAGGSHAGLTAFEAAMLPAATAFSTAHGLDAETGPSISSVLSRARVDVTRRLLGALYVEAPDTLPPVELHSVDALGSPAFDESALSAALSDRLRRLVDGWSSEPSRLLLVPFPTVEAAVVAPVARVHSFGHLEFAGPATVLTPDGHRRVGHPLDVVDLMASAGAFPDDRLAEQFHRYVDEGVANLALARLAERRLAREWPGVQEVFRSRTTPPHPLADPTLTLERVTAVAGHPRPPAAKTRCGMRPTESVRYVPECTDAVALRFVAVPNESVGTASTVAGPSYDETIRSTFDGIDRALSASLPSGASPDAYTVLPVHPWQFSHTVPRLRRQIGADQIVPLRDFARSATPLLSLRTVVPHGPSASGPLPHVKLPLDVIKLLRRTLPPAEVGDGPVLSDLLESILATERIDRLGVLDEFTGAWFRPVEGPDSAEVGARLSALFRTNPYAHPLVEDGRLPVTAACLLADVPGSEEAILSGFVERYASAAGVSDRREAAMAFFADYVACVLPGSLRLLSGYGIALEPHSQNTVVLFDRDARPRSALVRDFGGIRIDARRLARRGFAVAFAPDSAVDAGPREIHELYHALVYRQLGELVIALARTVGVPERRCWDVVRASAEATFETLRADPDVPNQQVDRDAARLFGETLEVLSFTTKRILGRTEMTYGEVPNPLAGR